MSSFRIAIVAPSLLRQQIHLSSHIIFPRTGIHNWGVLREHPQRQPVVHIAGRAGKQSGVLRVRVEGWRGGRVEDGVFEAVMMHILRVSMCNIWWWLAVQIDAEIYLLWLSLCDAPSSEIGRYIMRIL